ncbi:MAG: hypothetical protein Q8Q05_02100 [bacterium]|nr:hypothetical protein [bacterium]
MKSLKREGLTPHFAVKRSSKGYFAVERSKHGAGFSVLELILVMFIVSLFAGLVSSTILKSYSNNRLVETQSIVQTELNLAVDRLSRVLRSSTAILEATETNFKIRGYPSTADNAPSEINFYLQNSALKYSVIPPTGTAPNYTYNVNNAKYYTLLGKTSNSTANPVFRFYNDQNVLFGFPVSIAGIKVVETNLSALDTNNVLPNPIIVTTKITLRNFKTNL